VAAARHGDREAGQARLQLVEHGGGRAPSDRRVGAWHQDHQLALREHAGVLVRAAGAVARPAGLGQRGERTALDGLGAALRKGEHSRPPVALLGPLRAGPHDDRGGSAGQLAPQLRRARHDVLPIGHAAGEQVLEEVADRCLARALRRS
jgi:hypothetical protein